MKTSHDKKTKNHEVNVWYTEKYLKLTKEKNVMHFGELLRSYFHKYCEISTIHGVRYLYDPNIGYIERLIWTGLVITSVVLTSTAYGKLADRFGEKRLVTVIEDAQYPVFNIPFPAVGFCTSNRINWSKLEDAKLVFLPSGADSKTVELFDKFVERMEAMKFGHFGNFGEIEDENLELLDFLDVTELAEFLTLKCEDIFYLNKCRWRGNAFDCCKYLNLEKTEAGLCLVFNSLFPLNASISAERRADKYYPQHNSKAGQGTGLNVELHLDNKFKRPNSSTDDNILIMIKKPDQWTGTGYTVIPNAESLLIIRPDITDTDKTTLHLTPEQRNCVFKEETYAISNRALVGGQYRRRNCLSVCHEEHVIKYCNCTLPLYFYGSNTTKQCKPAHFRCLARNSDIFKTDKRIEEGVFYSTVQAGMICNCYISCASLDFFTSLTTLPIPAEQLSPDPDVKIFKIDVHYQSDVFVKFRTSLEFSIMDLIANFGGIFGLCMGASMVSAVELIYHLTIGFGLYLYDNNFWSTFMQNLNRLRQKLVQIWRNTISEENNEGEETIHKEHPRYQQKSNAW